TDFAAILLSNKIYFYGGWNSSILNDFFYIDLSQSFDASNPPFQFNFTLTQKGGYSAITYEDEMIIFGGYNTVGNINDLVIIKEVPSNFTRTITSTNSSNPNSWPSQRKWPTAVIDSTKAKMYVWGGSETVNPNNAINDGAIYILDVLSYSWSINIVPTQPIGRQRNTATLIPDGNIIMIGGYFNPDIAQLDIYNTITGQWSQKIATIIGTISARWGHTATLATNNQSIIMFGGISNSSETIDGIAVLNLTDYVWTSVTPSGNSPSETPNSHTATLYNDYIFFAFGIIGTSTFINTVSILDISNSQYKWVYLYSPRASNPNPSITNTTSTAGTSNISNNLNIGIIVGSVFGSVVEIRAGNVHVSANEVVDNRMNVNRIANNESANNEVVFDNLWSSSADRK
ncbi:13819_t:CDS:2, partial [Dentiscutata erythropus]